MSLTADEIIKVMERARDLGAVSVVAEGLNVQFGSAPPQKITSEPTPDDELMKPMSTLDELSPEEILMYSTPYFDEIQAKKEAHKKALEKAQDG